MHTACIPVQASLSYLCTSTQGVSVAAVRAEGFGSRQGSLVGEAHLSMLCGRKEGHRSFQKALQAASAQAAVVCG